MIGRAAAIVVVCTIACGCGTKINQAAFGVASDLPLAMLDGVTAVLAGGPQKSWPLGGDSMSFLPSAISVYAIDDRLPAFDLTIIGTQAGAEVLRRRVRTTLLPEQTRFVRLALEARCIGVACGADQTCVEGVCASVDFDLTRALPYVSDEEFTVECGDPMFRFTVDDTILPPPDGGCQPAQPCVEGTCYQPAGAPPVAGAGSFASGSLDSFELK